MGLADVGEALWCDHLKHNPADPKWANRDRFVLSNGHGSMLLYSLLHLTGYDLPMAELKNFRQLGSSTAGHPEYGECPGVETTTGPLGQGLANAVGMALAERSSGEAFNRPGFEIVDHKTYVIVGDGCLMEGISHEAASLAGTLQLGKLVCLYDDNGISIDGEVEGWFAEDVPARFEAYGWRVIRDVDGHDGDAVSAALQQCQELGPDQSQGATGKPTLICCRTVIGFGSPAKAGTSGAHGAALGEDEIAATRKQLNWGHAPFEIPQHISEAWDQRPRGATAQQHWEEVFAGYTAAHPDLAAEFSRRNEHRLPENWAQPLQQLATDAQANPVSLATRQASQKCITAIAQTLPELFGGSADLTGSNLTRWDNAPDTQYMNFGVREFAMTAITNGMLLHGGWRTQTGTFLVFMEYARNAVRLAALMGLPNVFVYTHDSVAVGEDGPTHQPVEQLVNLRSTPNLSTWRPCDLVESAVAWEAAINRLDGPSALIFSRQKTTPQARDAQTFANVARGGYVLREEVGKLQVILIATGSEVQLAIDAAIQLTDQGVGARVVSMPSTDVFLAQPAAYREEVLPSDIAGRVAVEAAHSESWYRFVGLQGVVVGIDRFGVCAPGAIAMAEMGMTVANVVAAAQSSLDNMG